MRDEDAEVEIITVLHKCENGWHEFTSPQIPGLFMVVEQTDLAAAWRDLPRAIEKLIFVDTGDRVTVMPEKMP
jgi:hypothetical protein